MNSLVTRTLLLALTACSAGLVDGLANGRANAQFRWNGDGTVERIEPPRRSPNGFPNWSTNPYLRSAPQWQDGPPTRQFPLPQMQPPRSALSTVDEVRDGGPRPDIQPLAPPVANFPHAYPAGSIVIEAQARQLYYVLPGNKAFVYQVSVGREGFGWTGTEVVTRKQDWPDWHPPAEMRARDPRLPAKMMGGIDNPLGAMALYLGNTLYRIHGTNDEKTLGQASSSGCFRMMNASVLHLASITEVGTRVHVVEALAPPQRVSGMQLAPPPPPAYMYAPRPPRREMWPGGQRSQWDSGWERAPWLREPQPYPPFPGWR